MRALAAAVFVLAAGIVPAGCGHGASENEANVTPPPATVKVATVRQATVPITEDYQGTIGAIESVEVRARVEGTLDRAPFQEGALVHRGDLIFQIQQSEYLAALHAAQAQLAAAQGNLFA
ncbi:MAG: biotin/lipoyl-binding protein, partial [Candidatus Cybelea sp.]